MSDKIEGGRCPTHGTFTGSVGCPFCAAVESPPGKAKSDGVTVLSKGGANRGVEEISKRAGTPQPDHPVQVTVQPGHGRTVNVYDKGKRT